MEEGGNEGRETQEEKIAFMHLYSYYEQEWPDHSNALM